MSNSSPLFAYVELKDQKHFRLDKSGHGANCGSSASAAKLENVLWDDVWDLQQSGASLLVTHKRTGARYVCPFNDVKVAKYPEDVAEDERPAKKGKETKPTEAAKS